MLDQRQEARTGMIRSACLMSGGTGLDCALLDLSASGARVSLLSAADLPDMVMLRLPDGAAHAVRRRWQRNAQIGFEFLMAAPRWPNGAAGSGQRRPLHRDWLL